MSTVSESPCWEIKKDEMKGRCVFSRRAIPKGNTVIATPSFATIVSPDSRAVVCACCVKEPTSKDEILPIQYPNEGCLVRYCSVSCQKIDSQIHKYECSFRPNKSLSDYASDYARLIARTLIRAHLEPRHASWSHIEGMWFSLDAQNDQQVNEYAVVSGELEAFIKKELPGFVVPVVDREFSLKLSTRTGQQHSDLFSYIYSLISKEECNSFGLYTFNYLGPASEKQGYGLALFPEAVYFNHSCCPNLGRNYNDAGEIEFYTIRDVPPGEELTISYLDLKLSRSERQSILQKYFLFECTCVRCKEEEVGVGGHDLSLATCGQECLGWYRPDPKQGWKCIGCNNILEIN